MIRRPYRPSDGGADMGGDQTPEETRRRVADILKQMEDDVPAPGPGLRCPKCGARLVHYRLHGYRCSQGCN